MSLETERKMLLSYGPRELDILNRVDSEKLCPSKNEAWRRGLFAFDELYDLDEDILLQLLSQSLGNLVEAVNDHSKFVIGLRRARALSKTVRAVMAIKRGVLETEFFDAATATLDNYTSALGDDSLYREIDKTRLKEELLGLQSMAKLLETKYKEKSSYTRDEIMHIAIQTLVEKIGQFVDTSTLARKSGTQPNELRRLLLDLRRRVEFLSEDLSYDVSRDAFMLPKRGIYLTLKPQQINKFLSS